MAAPEAATHINTHIPAGLSVPVRQAEQRRAESNLVMRLLTRAKVPGDFMTVDGFVR